MLDRIKQLQKDLRNSSLQEILAAYWDKKELYPDPMDLEVLPDLQFSDMWVGAIDHHVYLNFMTDNQENFHWLIRPHVTVHRFAGYIGRCYQLNAITIECYLNMVGEYRV